MSKDREQYTMGYGPAATAIMAMRTAQSHAAFFLPHLKRGMTLLDCGCGPGTITLGFAELVAPGQVVGTEIENSHVALARENAVRPNIANVRFETADIYELPFADASFDAVFISAVLGNLREPIRGLREAHRVLKPGGVIGVKEFDHGGDLVYPTDPALEKYDELYLRLRRENGHDPEGGRKIGVLLVDAGFRDLKMSPCYESFADPKARRGFAEVSAGLLQEGWADAFLSRGWATAEDIKQMSDAWRRFASAPGAIFGAAWCEAVARKEGAR
jgi:ubiquinone/menaquinone biosynthesis C-methylase UbiE